ncbi:hypothetical protein JHK87_048115 [Glycine soja]|nr:hypothetical protein JHK87_048115 [Glycine soja]|eukprot:XP_006601672.1 zinc finger protein 11-like [Glycine max]
METGNDKFMLVVDDVSDELWSSQLVDTLKLNQNHNEFGSYQDYVNGFPWPPRSYTYSFCRKEFKSAQALGGHMNVHRRDRPRLRQSSPLIHEVQGQAAGPIRLNLNLDPNNNSASS